MPLYRYIVKDAQGNTSAGRLEAPDPHTLARQLQEMGYWITHIEEVRSAEIRPVSFGQFIQSIFEPLASFFRLQSLVIYFRQFATMLNSGLTISRSLSTLAAQAPGNKLRQVSKEIGQRIESGAKLSEAMEPYPYIFSELHKSLIRAGETSGTLEENMRRIADFIEFEYRLRTQLISGLTYPIILAHAAIFLPPLYLLVRGNPIAYLRSTFGFLIPAYFVIAFVYIFSKISLRTTRFRRIWDTIKLSLPVVSGITRRLVTARFARAFQSLYNAGMGVLQCTELSANICGNELIKQSILQTIPELQRGGKLSDALRRANAFPEMVLNMIATGEESGRLDEMLTKVGEYYEAESREAQRRLIISLTVGMFLLVALYIAYIVISFWTSFYGSLVSP